MALWVPKWPRRFCEEGDLLVYEPNLESDVPRIRARDEAPLWSMAIDLGMDEVERRLRGTRSTGQAFEMGRLGLRSKERLRPATARFALHFLYDQNQTFGDGPEGRMGLRARAHLEMAAAWLSIEALALDYDADSDGTIGLHEQGRPFSTVFVRG